MYFQKIIDETLEEKDHIKSGKFVPSMFGACFRRQIYNRKAIPPSNPFDERTLRVFKMGYLIEEFACSSFLARFPEAKRQVKIETEDVLGYCDIDWQDEVIDIKSTHSQAFHYLKDDNIREQKRNNWLQIMYYSWKLEKPKGRLVLVSRDDLCIAEYVQDFKDGYWLEELANELNTLNHYWTKEIPPEAKPRLYIQKDGSSKECGYCLWKDYCKKEELNVRKDL